MAVHQQYFLRFTALLAGLSILPLLCTAAPFTLESARQQLRQQSDQLAAARAEVESKRFKRESIEWLGGPTVSLVGSSYSYSASATFNLDPVNEAFGQASQALTHYTGLSVNNITLPSEYTYTQRGSGSRASLSAIWPLYIGGATDHLRGLAQAQINESEADAARTTQELSTLLVQRYFGAQLTAYAARLRATARDNVAQHNQTAERLLQAGLISRTERLQAKVAYEEAQRNALKAQDDADLTELALSSLLKSETPVETLSPLFVIAAPLDTPTYYTELALANHPGLRKVAAKKEQAAQLHEEEKSLQRPQLFAFGQQSLKTDNPDWVVGIGARWTLWSPIDHRAQSAASSKRVEQAERTDAQARADITLLVQRNWRLVENARRQFLGHQNSAELAAEMRRLRSAALREGTGTALELIDAETNLAKVQTERAQAAYDYVVALAQLLESCGLSEEFDAYLARADVRLE